jgi:hypothetical protein
MNCQNFENILDDLSRNALMDARTREAALAHADACPRCASRLADEKALRAGLRSLAASASGREAPPRVEAALLAAFRTQAGANATEETSAPAIADGKVTPLRRPAADKRWTWLKTVTTAATAAAAAALLLMIIPPGTDAPSGGGGVAGTRTTTAQKQGGPEVAEMIEPVPHFDRQNEAAPPDVEVADIEQPRSFNSPRGGGRVTATPVSYNTPGGRRPQAARGGGRGAKADREVFTEFIPLGHGDYYSASVEAGQVLRVELPRSALSSIGMPVSADRAGERIKADVLVGEDGVARAIRFVR